MVCLGQAVLKKRVSQRKIALVLCYLGLLLVMALSLSTYLALQELPSRPADLVGRVQHQPVLSREGAVLSHSYQTRWNVHQQVALEDVPVLLKEAFLISEDKRFYQHQGVDWSARLAALAANVLNLRKVRGASTISEQVVRLIHPRKRTLWSRWLEGFEASALERQWSKQEILTFYLNQVPYASNRRGVVQAAQFYFDRTVDTLNTKEQLALAVLVRAPSRYDLWRDAAVIDGSIKRLHRRMLMTKNSAADARWALLSDASEQTLLNDKQQLDEAFVLRRHELAVYAPEFIRYVRQHHAPDVVEAMAETDTKSAKTAPIRTTLDHHIQQQAQTLLDTQLERLRDHHISNGALLVVDRNTAEIMAWVNGANQNSNNRSRAIDAVLVKRQVGSVLKPFVYALAIEQGWNAATLIDDAPLVARIGYGQHHFRNYSGQFYGPISLRKALGNSLNTPAVRAIEYTGVNHYLDFLRGFGVQGIQKGADYYGSGAALGNIELSLFDVVTAYTALARAGQSATLNAFIRNHSASDESLRLTSATTKLSPSTALLITDILQDHSARHLEFGQQSVLNFPLSTAVKTGTSTAYRDSWIVAYDEQFIIGAWMGNLNGEASFGVTGSSGPALVVRSLFDRLRQRPAPNVSDLFDSKWAQLESREVCVKSGLLKLAHQSCESYQELFAIDSLKRTAAEDDVMAATHNSMLMFSTDKQINPKPPKPMMIAQPTPGLHMAFDPRVPSQQQAYRFMLDGVQEDDRVDWVIDSVNTTSTTSASIQRIVKKARGASMLWPIQRGKWLVTASVYRDDQVLAQLPAIEFTVK